MTAFDKAWTFLKQEDPYAISSTVLQEFGLGHEVSPETVEHYYQKWLDDPYHESRRYNSDIVNPTFGDSLRMGLQRENMEYPFNDEDEYGENWNINWDDPAMQPEGRKQYRTEVQAYLDAGVEAQRQGNPWPENPWPHSQHPEEQNE